MINGMEKVKDWLNTNGEFSSPLPSPTIGEGINTTPTPTLPRGREKYGCNLRNVGGYIKVTVLKGNKNCLYFFKGTLYTFHPARDFGMLISILYYKYNLF
jgi:hypothetical protein